MSVKNYLTVVANLQSFANAHMQIQRFKSSYLSKIEGFAKEDREFPIMYAIPNQITAQRYTNIYSFRVYILDKTNNAGDNEIAILNTGENILRDLAIWIKESQNGLELENEPIMTPIEDYLMDWGFIGWYADYDVMGPAFSSDCSIPFVDNFLTDFPAGVNCDISYPAALTCDTLSGCTTIQTIQYDIQELQNKQFTGGTVSGFTSFINGLSASTLQGDGSALILSKSQLTNTIGYDTYIPYTGATKNVDLGINELITGKLYLYDAVGGPDEKGSLHYADEALHFENSDGETLLYVEPGFMQIHNTGNIQSNLFVTNLSETRNHYLPNKSGTILVDTDLSLYQSKSEKNIINGYAGLDSNGLLPLNLFNDALLGNVHFKGTYNGSLITSSDTTINNVPLPIASSGNTGWYFISTSAYTANTIAYEVGDWILSLGTSGWSKVDNTDAVTSVFGRIGAVTLLSSDVTSALGYTPYPNTNPNRFISGSGLNNSVAFFNGTNSLSATTGFVYNGNLGLGTSTPVAANAARRALVISDTTNDTTLRLEGASGVTAEFFTTGTVTGIGTRSANGFNLTTNNLNRLSINSSGNILLGDVTNFVATHTLTFPSTSTGIANYTTADQTTNYQRVRQYWSSGTYYMTGENAGTASTVNTVFGTRSASNNITFNQTVTGGVGGNSSLISLNAGGATWQPALYSGTTYKAIYNTTGTILGTAAGTHNFYQISPTIQSASAYTSPITVVKITPNIQNIGTGTTYLIDAGTNTSDSGLGTHTSVFSVDNSGNTKINGKISFATTGSTATVGQVTLTAGTATVTNANVATTSLIFLTCKTIGGTQGLLRYTSSAGTFTITSSSATDTSVINWWIIN
jgi:hypothetical protein